MPLLGDTFRVEAVNWHSPLPVDMVEERLRGVGLTGIGSLFTSFGAPLRGRVRVDRVTAAKRSFVNNSWAPLFVGRLESSIGGTTLSGEIRVNRFTQMFLGLWLCLAALGSVAGVLSTVRGDLLGLIALAFPLWAVLICQLGAVLARSHWSFIRTTLGIAIDGTESPVERLTT